LINTSYKANKNPYISFQRKMRNNGELSDLSVKYIKKNPPPTNILNIGLHGSSADVLDLKKRPFSDIDFFCIANEYDKNSINYLRKFIDYFNKKAGTWVDMMMGETNNKGFSLIDFDIDNLANDHMVFYGENFEDNIEKLRKNASNEDSIIVLYEKTKGAGLKLKKGLLLLNSKQHVVSFPPIAMKNIKGKKLKTRAITLSKSILTSCSFANSAMGYLNGRPVEYSKRKSPEMLEELFGIDSKLAKKARDIYYCTAQKIDLKKFIEEDAFEWLKTQEQIETTLETKIKTSGKALLKNIEHKL